MNVLLFALSLIITPTHAFSRKSSPTKIWVSRSDGALSCEKEKAQSLEAGEQELKDVQVKVHASKKGNDGKMYAQMCGGPTGSLNTYEISKSDLQKAQKLGFSELLTESTN